MIPQICDTHCASGYSPVSRAIAPEKATLPALPSLQRGGRTPAIHTLPWVIVARGFHAAEPKRSRVDFSTTPSYPVSFPGSVWFFLFVVFFFPILVDPTPLAGFRTGGADESAYMHCVGKRDARKRTKNDRSAACFVQPVPSRGRTRVSDTALSGDHPHREAHDQRVPVCVCVCRKVSLEPRNPTTGLGCVSATKFMT